MLEKEGTERMEVSSEFSLGESNKKRVSGRTYYATWKGQGQRKRIEKARAGPKQSRLKKENALLPTCL